MTWRRHRWLGVAWCVLATVQLLVTIEAFTSDDESGWRLLVVCAQLVGFSGLAWVFSSQRAVADADGVRVYTGGWRPSSTVPWSRIRTIEPSARTAWYNHVVLHTTDDKRVKLPTMRADQVDELRALRPGQA